MINSLKSSFIRHSTVALINRCKTSKYLKIAVEKGFAVMKINARMEEK